MLGSKHAHCQVLPKYKNISLHLASFDFPFHGLSGAIDIYSMGYFLFPLYLTVFLSASYKVVHSRIEVDCEMLCHKSV